MAVQVYHVIPVTTTRNFFLNKIIIEVIIFLRT